MCLRSSRLTRPRSSANHRSSLGRPSLRPTVFLRAFGFDASEVREGCDDWCVVGAWGVAALARVGGDRGKRLVDDRLDGDRVKGLDDLGGDEDVVDQFLAALVDTGVVLSLGHQWGEVPEALPVALVWCVEAGGADL